MTPRDPKVGASEREVSLHQIPHHAERNHHQHFVLPPKEELPITEVTVGKFLDLFCTANPSVSPIVNPPWEEIIKVFKQYVMTYYEHEPGKVKHISQALSRTKHQIPQDLVAKETRQLLTNVDKVKVEKVQATSTNESLAMVSSDPRKRLREEAHDSPYHINKHVRTEVSISGTDKKYYAHAQKGPSNTVSERMDLDSPKLEDDTASAWVSASSDKGVAAGSLSRPSNGTDVVASRGIRLYSPSNPTFPPLALIGGTTANGADSGMITDKLNGGRGGAQSPTMGSQTRATLPGLTGVNATVELRPSSISGIGTRGTSAPTIAALASNGHSVPVASTPNGVGNHVGIGAVQTPNPQSALLQSVESHISRVETSIKTSLSYLEKVKLGLGSNGDSDASPNLVVVEYLQQGALTEIKKLKRVLQKQAS